MGVPSAIYAGPIPSTIVKLKQLTELNLGGNKLSGECSYTNSKIIDHHHGTMMIFSLFS